MEPGLARYINYSLLQIGRAEQERENREEWGEGGKGKQEGESKGPESICGLSLKGVLCSDVQTSSHGTLG